jgi:transcriptional regulator with XRE-family HTH domain
MQQTFSDVIRTEIRAEMARQRLSQQNLADKLGWGQTVVSKRLTGKVAITADEVKQIADALGVTPAVLGWSFEEPRVRGAAR